MSLICASLTWLRNHKAAQFDVSLQEAGEAFKDEPQWIVDQLLRQKRNDLLRRWEDREERMKKARQTEKSLEAAASKRRRIDVSRGASKRTGATSDDDDDEWLLDDVQDQKPQEKDALSGLSKESRDVLTRIGLGSTIKREEDSEVLGEPLKVCVHDRSCVRSDIVVTAVDLLHLANTFPALTVHRRIEATKLSAFAASLTCERWQREK